MGLNPKYALDFLQRFKTIAKSIASLHLTHSPELCYASFAKCLIYFDFSDLSTDPKIEFGLNKKSRLSGIFCFQLTSEVIKSDIFLRNSQII